MRHTQVNTGIGPVWFSAAPLEPGPAVLLLHGAGRTAADLMDVAERLPNCVLGHLPDHGVNELATRSVDAWSRAIATALVAYLDGRPVLMAGESLGGLVCLGMARFPIPGLIGLVAFEPPLTYSWPIEASQAAAYLKEMLRPSSRHWLSTAVCPVTVVAGDEPLEPPRWCAEAPSILSEADRQACSDLIVIPGGHALMTQSPQRCADIVLDRLALWTSASPAPRPC